jgi:hypothetical protein
VRFTQCHSHDPQGTGKNAIGFTTLDTFLLKNPHEGITSRYIPVKNKIMFYIVVYVYMYIYMYIHIPNDHVNVHSSILEMPILLSMICPYYFQIFSYVLEIPNNF